jgi:hypothetical protein
MVLLVCQAAHCFVVIVLRRKLNNKKRYIHAVLGIGLAPTMLARFRSRLGLLPRTGHCQLRRP